MGPSGEDVAKGGVIYPCVGYILLGVGTGVAAVWFRVVGHVGGNDEDDGGNARRLPPEDRVKFDMYNHKQDVLDTDS